MGSLLIFGTIWFWVLIGVVILLSIYYLDEALSKYTDSGGGSKVTYVLIGGLLLYYFFGSKDHVLSLFDYIRDNPLKTIGWIGVYILIGLIWGFIKWYFYLQKRYEYEKTKEYVYEFPKASDNKYRIMSWMIYWPFSATWTVIDQPLKNAFGYVFVKFENMFDFISEKIFADLIAEREALRKERNENANKKSS